MANKSSPTVLMSDQQYYNAGFAPKSNTLNKSTLAAMSRENLHQPPHKRMEPKHLQPPPLPRSGPPHRRQDKPDLIKDFNKTHSVSNGHPPSGYRSESADSLRKSQGTNTKHPQREFQIYQNTQHMNGRHDESYHNSLSGGRDATMYKQKSFNGLPIQEPHRSFEVDRKSSQAQRPNSRGVTASGSAIELINMNYNAIQQQLERNLLLKSRPQSRMKIEEGQRSEQPSSGRDLSQTLPIDDSSRNATRMSQAEIVRNRSMAAGRHTSLEPPHLRKSRSEDSPNVSSGYQHFTQDKVMPIHQKRHDEVPKQNHGSKEPEVTVSRSRIPPHERNSRLSKENMDQLRKPRTDGPPVQNLKESDLLNKSNIPPHLNTSLRQQPMGAEAAVLRPATSMGFSARSTTPRNQPPSKETERQMNVREKLQHFQRRKSTGPSLETSMREFDPTSCNESPQARSESRAQRPPSGAKDPNRRRSYTTSTPAKARAPQDRPSSRATDKLRQSVDGRTSRTSSDSNSSKELQYKDRSSARLGDVIGNKNLETSVPSFPERSAMRWQEIEQLAKTSPPDAPHENRNGGRGSSRADYPFFLDFSKSTPEITSSIDSLNQEVSEHLGSSSRVLINDGKDQNKHSLLAISSDTRMTSYSDLDCQGTPQLSSPMDFDPMNPASSSNEDLDMEVRTLLGHPENQMDTIDMALYQQMINETIHKNISSLRDRRSVLEKKDNDLKFKRERLQRRMHQTLAKTTAVLNKSLELEKSRAHVDIEVLEPTNAEELAVLHALSSTVRPKTSSASQGLSNRPQHVSDSFHNHSTIVSFNDPLYALSDMYDIYAPLRSPSKYSRYTASDDHSEVNEASLSFSFHSIIHQTDPSYLTPGKNNELQHDSSRAEVVSPVVNSIHSPPEQSAELPSQSAIRLSEVNEGSLFFNYNFHSIAGDVTEPDLSQCESTVTLSELSFASSQTLNASDILTGHSLITTPTKNICKRTEINDNSVSCSFRTIQSSESEAPRPKELCQLGVFSPMQRDFPDLSIIEPCECDSPGIKKTPLSRFRDRMQLVPRQSRCSYNFSLSPCRPPKGPAENTTSDQNIQSTMKRKSTFSCSTPLANKQPRLISSKRVVKPSNFKRFCTTRRVKRQARRPRVTHTRVSPTLKKRKNSFESNQSRIKQPRLDILFGDDRKSTFRRFCATRRVTFRQMKDSRVLKIRSTPLPKLGYCET